MLISLHITHSSAGGMTCLGDIIPGMNDAINTELAENKFVDEYVVIRTCNRLEAYVATKNNGAMKAALTSLVKKNIGIGNRQVWYILEDKECIRHLFTVICGIDSLIVGEDQIQHQTKDAFALAQNEGHVGKVLYSLFNNAIIVGKRVRTETELNKGAVSVGYAAIELAQEKIGALEGKNIAIIGAGDMAGVIAKNLVGKGPQTVIVSNRTFQRAQELAKELEGTAIGFDRLPEIIRRSDLILVATSAKHNLLDKDIVGKAIDGREDKPLLIIDVSVPTNVDENVTELPNVSLHTMASLDSIAAENVAKRKKEITNAEKIIREELRRVEEEAKTEAADMIIKKMSVDFENIRIREVDKAMKCGNDIEKEILLDNLTHSIVSRICADIIKNLKNAAKNDEQDIIDAAKLIFNIDNKE